MDRFIYLDHCGTTPLAPEARLAMRPFLEEAFGNPSAVHHTAGGQAAEAVERARYELGLLLGAPYGGLVFTASATEANNLVLQGFALRHRECRLLIGATEHKSVYETALHCARYLGAQAIFLPVKKDGTLDPERLNEELLRSNRPTLVALMLVNNEIPARHPVEEIARICQAHGAHFHCDAVQGYVREAVDFTRLGASSMTLSAHKVYGPKGFGLLLLRDDITPLTPLLAGGEQERGRRPGTTNVAAVIGSTAAFKLHESRRESLRSHLITSQNTFLETLRKELEDWYPTVAPNEKAPGILNFWIEGVDASTLLSKVPNVCINRGASCTGAGGEKFSHVPLAVGLPVDVAANVLRVSFGLGASQSDCAQAARELAAAAKTIRA